MDTIVDCKTLKQGDVVRRPVPGAEWLEVLRVEGRTLFVMVLEAPHERFVMKGTSQHKWMVKRG